jgi:hypothetical protein
MRTTMSVICLVLLLISAAQAVDSLNVRLIGNCDTPGLANGVAVEGNYAFVADWGSGLRVISVADPAHPAEVGHADIPDAVAVAVSGNYAYVVCLLSGLRVFSVADPTHPTEVGYYDTPGLSYCVAVNGDYAYVTDADSGLWVISISDPTHPTEVGHWVVPDITYSIAVAGHFVYVADYFYGLRVVSVADPANPHEVGHNDSVGFAAVAVKGGYAYVGNLEDGLFAVSLADSAHPVQVGWCNTQERVTSIAVDDYVCAIGSSRLSVVSVSDPAHPDTVGHYYWLSWGAHSLATSGDFIYVATDSGLSVCQRYDAGVEETPNAELRATKCEPTVVRGVLHLEDRGAKTGDHAELLNATGRKVLDLHSGASDVSGLNPGVYYVRETLSGRQSAVGVCKVIITR